ALIDHPEFGDVAGANCETVHEGDPNSFRIETPPTPPDPIPPTPPNPVPPTPSVGEGTLQPEETAPKPPVVHRPPNSPCLARFKGTKVQCAKRPVHIGIGALGLLNRITWRSWGGRLAVGFGHLTISGGCCDRGVSARGKVRAFRLEQCGQRRWYTRLTVTYGRGYRKTYVRSYPSPTPCV
ncbi:MAG TPA: hypothetical protein VIY71_01440, partial [Solirubrobacterales bacterium]